MRHLFSSILTPLTAALAASTLAFVLYTRLYPVREPRRIDLNTLPGTYAVVYRDACFGEATVLTELLDDVTSVSISGFVRLKRGTTVVLLPFNGEISFNILGQFGGAYLTSRSGENEMTAGAVGIDPIKLSLKNTAARSTIFERNFEIPGPIAGKRDRQNMFHLEYRNMDQFTSPVRLPISFVKQNVERVCPDGALEVDMALADLRSSLPPLPPFIESLITGQQ